MLASVKFDPKTTPIGSKTSVFDSGYLYNDGEGGNNQCITLSVGLDAVVSTASDDSPVPSADFPISIGYTPAKAYAVSASFSAAPPDKEAIDGVLKFKIDVSKKSASASVMRGGTSVKRKLSSMSWA
ncbi:hypothetical protein T484DRAFT_1757011 [Baffinella frigidus]|nr:hypothetical protein T484DRAFT_1757011 [Cryptophyta sp. CCMP2293]